MLTVLLVLCAVMILLVFLLLPGESSAAQRAPFWGVNHAHRGLHTEDKTIPENSLAAFIAAADAGYGIELDVQLTSDGEAVVFHDDELWRMCGVQGRLRDHDYDSLRQMRLLNTEQGIPTLGEALDAVDERVPLIVELKSMGGQNRRLCEAVWAVLRTYDGDFCVESFDPRIVRWFKKRVPGVLRGQLALRPGGFFTNPAAALAGWGLSHFLGRPQFLACEKGGRSLPMRLCGRFAMQVVWTARPGDDTDALELDNDAVIFEHYLPEPRYFSPPAEPAQSPSDEEFRF